MKNSFLVRTILLLGILYLASTLLKEIDLRVKTIFPVIFISIILSAAFTPMIKRLARFRVPRSVGVFSLYITCLAVLTGVAFSIIPMVTREVTTLSREVPRGLEAARRLLVNFDQEQGTNFADQPISKELIGQTSKFAGTIAESLSGMAAQVLYLSFSVMMILVLTYFLTTEDGLLARGLSYFANIDAKDDILAAVNRINEQLGAWARARFFLAILFGTTFGGGLWLLGIRYSATLGMIGVVMELIPYVGGAVTLVLALLVTVGQDPSMAIWVAGLYLFIQSIQGNVVEPQLMDRVLGIHRMVVVLALYAGAEMFGVMGTLLSIPMAIVVKLVYCAYQSYPQPLPEPPPALSHTPWLLKAVQAIFRTMYGNILKKLPTRTSFLGRHRTP